jgi:acetoin utilization deacetylase AcuC-like enzyme
VLFASIHQSPLYPGTGPLSDTGTGAGEGFSLNLPVPPGSGESTFVSLVQHVIAPAAGEFAPGLVLVSAGYDAHRDDPLASCELEDESYGALAACVRELGLPVGMVLEGGYALGALARSVAATIEALAGGAPSPDVEPDAVTEQAAGHLGRWWPLAV